MSYTKVKSTPAPKNDKSKWFVIILIFAIFFSCVWWFVFEPYSEKIQGDTSKVYQPGYHLVDKWPFTFSVDANDCASLVDKGWYYDIHYHGVVIIQHGYVGVISGDKGVEKDPLLPGRYYLDLNKYEVTTIYTEKQTYVFGDEPQ